MKKKISTKPATDPLLKEFIANLRGKKIRCGTGAEMTKVRKQR
jgi:hypothetical protein